MLFRIFARIVQMLVGTGLSRFPPVMKIYKFLYRSLLPKKSITLVSVQEHQMYVDIGDMGDVTAALVSDGIYHPQMTKVFQGTVSKGMTYIDIGANIGYFTLIAAKIVGEEGEIFAFEPEPLNFDLLVKNIALNKYENVIPMQKAISNKDGTAKLFVDRISFGSHSLITPGKDVHSFGQDTIEVEAQTLDSFFKNYTGKIDLVKIDVEGAELAVLEGMESIINQNKELIIITEFLPDGLSRFGSSPEEFLNRLVNYGFKLYNINEEKESVTLTDIASLLKECPPGKWTNILAKH